MADEVNQDFFHPARRFYFRAAANGWYTAAIEDLPWLAPEKNYFGALLTRKNGA